MDERLKAEFRSGFYPTKPAGWIDDFTSELEASTPDVRGCLRALEHGQRDFAYPGHDRAVYELLTDLVRLRGLRRGADIGCATGCFPAMQLHAGIEHCTVFEVRDTVIDEPNITVRVQDLGPGQVEPEFDLITCLSTIEHAGLGRYGDELDPLGDVKLAASLRRLLVPGGLMLMSFPVGRGCVVFNKHRVYTPYRQSKLFGDLVVRRRASDRTAVGRLRQWGARVLRKPGSFSQPIYVLERVA